MDRREFLSKLAVSAPIAGLGATALTVGTPAYASSSQTVSVARTIADLRNISGINDGDALLLEGYISEGDGGGGVFYWNATSTVADDGGTILQPTGVGTGRWYRLYQPGIIKAEWFGAVADGATDNSNVLATIKAFCAANLPIVLEFSHGTYAYTTSPNWGNILPTLSGLTIRGNGCTLKHTGAGYAFIMDSGSEGSFLAKCRLEDITVQGNATSAAGFYIQAVCDSEFRNLRCTGCAPTGNAFELGRIQTCVFDLLICNEKEGSFPQGCNPRNGLYIAGYHGYNTKWPSDGTGPHEYSSCNIFRNFNMCSVTNIGIYVDYCSNSLFEGGTSEGNTGYGVYVSMNSDYNTFTSLDIESNNSGAIYVMGNGNQFIGGYQDPLSTIYAGCGNMLRGGRYNVVTIDSGAACTILDGIGVAGGNPNNSSSTTVLRSVINTVTNNFIS